MRFLSRSHRTWRNLDASRIAATALVLFAHVALVLLLHVAMRTPDIKDSSALRETVLSLEFLPPESRSLLLPPPIAVESAAPRDRATRTKPKASRPSTAAIFLDDAPIASKPQGRDTPNSNATDAFDPPPAYKPFPQAPLLTSNLPSSMIRLPDRPSMLQAYWAVPEGENLQGRLARKVPLLGLLLVATGGIGQPDCPPKSEHPDCLRRLLDSPNR